MSEEKTYICYFTNKDGGKHLSAEIKITSDSPKNAIGAFLNQTEQKEDYVIAEWDISEFEILKYDEASGFMPLPQETKTLESKSKSGHEDGGYKKLNIEELLVEIIKIQKKQTKILELIRWSIIGGFLFFISRWFKLFGSL